jgi:putative FmdB family regulatory protein
VPVYEYICNDCQHVYDALRPASSRDDASACPSCGGSGRRQLSAFAFKDGRYGKYPRASAPRASSPKPEGETAE